MKKLVLIIIAMLFVIPAAQAGNWPHPDETEPLVVAAKTNNRNAFMNAFDELVKSCMSRGFVSPDSTVEGVIDEVGMRKEDSGLMIDFYIKGFPVAESKIVRELIFQIWQDHFAGYLVGERSRAKRHGIEFDRILITINSNETPEHAPRLYRTYRNTSGQIEIILNLDKEATLNELYAEIVGAVLTAGNGRLPVYERDKGYIDQ